MTIISFTKLLQSIYGEKGKDMERYKFTETELKSLFWLDQCGCGMTWDKRLYCTCKLWTERINQMLGIEDVKLRVY